MSLPGFLQEHDRDARLTSLAIRREGGNTHDNAWFQRGSRRAHEGRPDLVRKSSPWKDGRDRSSAALLLGL
jgi:hypothetical protein